MTTVTDSQEETIMSGATTVTTPSDREIVSERVFDHPATECSPRTQTRSSFLNGGVPGA